MQLADSHRIAASRERVFAALNDPDVLRQCIPGCESLEKTGDDQMKATVALKVGPVKARFSGQVTLSNIRPPEGYTISGEGSGGAAGFAKGSADVALEALDPETTLLKYDVNAAVGGKLAQLGGRLIDSTAKRLAEEFFQSFVRVVEGPEVEATSPAGTPAGFAAEDGSSDPQDPPGPGEPLHPAPGPVPAEQHPIHTAAQYDPDPEPEDVHWKKSAVPILIIAGATGLLAALYISIAVG